MKPTTEANLADRTNNETKLPAGSGSDGWPTKRGLEVPSGGSQPLPSELDANDVRASRDSLERQAASLSQGEPLWICFADNGNIRAWTRDHNRKELFRLDGLDMRLFYEATE